MNPLIPGFLFGSAAFVVGTVMSWQFAFQRVDFLRDINVHMMVGGICGLAGFVFGWGLFALIGGVDSLISKSRGDDQDDEESADNDGE